MNQKEHQLRFGGEAQGGDEGQLAMRMDIAPVPCTRALTQVFKPSLRGGTGLTWASLWVTGAFRTVVATHTHTFVLCI